MKSMHVNLAGFFVMTGLMTANVNHGRSTFHMLPMEIAGKPTYDTVPNKSSYRDLNTGETINIWYDAVGLRTLNKKTGALVEFYINTQSNDTVVGRGKFIVNGYIVKGNDDKWKLDDEKITRDGDDIKIKAGNQKFKIDEGEIKVKGNSKTQDSSRTKTGS